MKLEQITLPYPCDGCKCKLTFTSEHYFESRNYVYHDGGYYCKSCFKGKKWKKKKC